MKIYLQHLQIQRNISRNKMKIEETNIYKVFKETKKMKV